MADTDTELTTRTKLKLAGLFLLAVAVGLSWLGLALFVPADPTGFLVSGASDDGAAGDATEALTENVSIDDLREALSRSSRGVSPKAVTAIWATGAYWERADITTEAFRVSPDENYVFIVFMDTHTGALPDMNWTNDTTLYVDGRAVEPVEGYTRAGGYHHMVAVVQFPKTVDDTPIMTPDTGNVTLQVVGADRTTRDVPNDKPRNLTWAYPPPYHGGSDGGSGS